MEGGIPRFTVDLATVSVGPSEIVAFWYESDEIRHLNDMHVSTFRYSTHKPRVRIDAPVDIGWIVEFAHRQSAKRYGQTTILSALLLPNQSIIVRWWDKTAELNWRNAHPRPIT